VDAVSAIQKFTQGMEFKTFAEDRRTVDAVVHNPAPRGRTSFNEDEIEQDLLARLNSREGVDISLRDIASNIHIAKGKLRQTEIEVIEDKIFDKRGENL
jgi:hypothetical protein